MPRMNNGKPVTASNPPPGGIGVAIALKRVQRVAPAATMKEFRSKASNDDAYLRGKSGKTIVLKCGRVERYPTFVKTDWLDQWLEPYERELKRTQEESMSSKFPTIGPTT